MVMAVVISNCVTSQHYENPSELTGTVELRSELVWNEEERRASLLHVFMQSV